MQLSVLEPAINFYQSLIQARQSLLGNGRRYAAVISFRNTAGNAGLGIAVPPQGDRVADGILIIDRFQKRQQRLRNRALTGDIKIMVGANFIQGP